MKEIIHSKIMKKAKVANVVKVNVENEKMK